MASRPLRSAGCHAALVPIALALAALTASAGASPVAAQTLTATEIASGLSAPVWVGSPPGDDRIFVLEQFTSRILVVEAGVVTGTFLDLSGEASGPGQFNGERGLLGMAFHPDFVTNGLFFVDYTIADSLGGDTKVVRYQVSAGDPDVADPASAKLILQQTQPFQNHNAGDLAFGPDGYLYVGFGDGGNGGDPFCAAQDGATFLGKMLRLDVDTDPAPYAIPAGNPFDEESEDPGDQILDEIWHFGLRNPWRYGFDPLTGDLYVADVGQGDHEEVSVQPAGVGGLDFGWNVMEGVGCPGFSGQGCSPSPPPCDDPAYTDPVWDYDHGQTPGVAFARCAIIGGEVYRGSALPGLAGSYFFADVCSGEVWSMVAVGGTLVSGPVERHDELFCGTKSGISSFGVDGDGELLIATLDGRIWRVEEVGGATDCDGDGTADTCQIAADPLLDLDADGGLDACQELSADVATVSIASGGLQTLSLHHEPQHADKVYWLVGSTSGTSPGLDGDGQHLPLNPDAYFSFTLGFPNIFPLVDSLGILDGKAEATAGFFVPAGVLDGSLAGLTFHHAYAVLELGPITVVATSNAIPVTLDV